MRAHQNILSRHGAARIWSKFGQQIQLGPLPSFPIAGLNFHTERGSQFADRCSFCRADLFSAKSKETTLGCRIGNFASNRHKPPGSLPENRQSTSHSPELGLVC